MLFKPLSLSRLGLLLFGVLIWTALMSALAASNTVPGSRASDSQDPITPNDLKPPECAGLNLTAKIVGSGTLTGTNAAELIIGGPGADTISGGGRGDCILGGGGADNINGNAGNDVVLGGAGNDTINGALGSDVCYGEAGTDTFSNCETQLQ
jgi:Ca2+-binding RTX toxin-like protein